MATELDLETLKSQGEAPQFMTLEGFKHLSAGFLLDGETPVAMYRRVSKAAAARLRAPELESKFFDYIYKGWLCLATPVASNMGVSRGLPISCFSLSVPDSIDGIFKSVHELAIMSKNGGGVGFCASNIRGRGKRITGNGESEGVIPWLKIFDTTTVSVSQGSVRRGASAAYLDINHVDIDEFIRIRRPTGDANRQCLNIHHGVVVNDDFMRRVDAREPKAVEIWKEVLRTRFETGEPYILFIDNVNNANPPAYRNNGLRVETSNICSEIALHTDADHSFVCCLSSLNLTKYDQWKDTDLVRTSIWFLDAVMQEFIDRAKSIGGMERAVRFAEKGRALGLGVLGWHTLLQSKMLPFDSFKSQQLNSMIFKKIRSEADAASRELAARYGEPEWCKGTGMRNTHTLAVAPTVTNSTIAGNVSAGIEPIAANAFVKKSARGSFIQKNNLLERLLVDKGVDVDAAWKSIVENDGSVQHLDYLTDKEKEVFLTAREINQMAIITQAASRQRFIDQAQSINLFFPADVDPRWFNKIHMEAWRSGIKSLYYCRTGSVLKGDIASRFYDTSCKSCEG